MACQDDPLADYVAVSTRRLLKWEELLVYLFEVKSSLSLLIIKIYAVSSETF